METPQRFDCLHRVLRALVKKHKHGALASSASLQSLAERWEIRLAPAQELAAGGAILYYDGDRLTDGARIGRGELLTSKWG